jgi:hypothetical protein
MKTLRVSSLDSSFILHRSSFVYALALFQGALLLFCVQPMVAKMVLPLLGGSPAVWSTCMVFFQAALLVGYAYAHTAATWLRPRQQAIVQAGLVVLPLFALPVRISARAAGSVPANANPSAWLLWMLIGVVGLPFFVLSTSAPLLQRWFGHSSHPDASDPYFLYGASNLGSMTALLAYPLLIEPYLTLTQQRMAWAAGYGVFVCLTLACATVPWKVGRHTSLDSVRSRPQRQDRAWAVQYSRWIIMAFVPSSFMLGITTYMTSDIAAMPLLWVIPLAVYLLTFILTFSRRRILPHSWMVRAFPMAAVVHALVMKLALATQPLLIPVHLVSFFLAAMVCHGEIARTRPSPDHLTAFYLSISFGGVLGGLFNALLAPVVFDRIVELPLALVFACMVLPQAAEDGRGHDEGRTMPAHGGRGHDNAVEKAHWLHCLTHPSSLVPRLTARFRADLAAPVLLGALLWGSLALLKGLSDSEQRNRLATALVGLASVACYTLKGRPLRFAVGISALFLAGGAVGGDDGPVLFQHRDYFGVVRVTHDLSGNYHRLIHGQTMHGLQSLDAQRRGEPLAYYHRTGPIGQVFSVLGNRIARSNIAIVGLGAGALACYAQAGQRWTFYEIDPVIAQVASDSRFFTYLRDCRAAAADIVLGDARLRLRAAPDHGYGLIVLDAFSSDAIPTHLLTREALRLYVDKLSDGGAIAFHISNKYIDLAGVLAALAADSQLKCLVRRDTAISLEDARLGKSASMWAVMAPRESDLGDLAKDSSWKSPQAHRGDAAWTDDYSSIAAHLVVFRR